MPLRRSESRLTVLDLEVGARARLLEPKGSPHAAKTADDLQAAITERSDEDRVELPGGALLAVPLTFLRIMSRARS